MKKEYYKYIDLLNIFATIAVIAMHVNGCFWSFSYENYWRVSVIIETAFYWAVPIFFMISGAMLIDYRERYSTKVYFKKRILKTAIPFLIWSIISLFYAIKIGSLSTDVFHPRNFINAVLNSKGIPIYWFFMPLFAIYFAIPILSLIPKEKRKFAYSYMVLFAFITGVFGPPIFQIVGLNFPGGLGFPLTGGYMVCVLLGYLLAHNYEFNIAKRLIIYCFGILGWFIRYYTVLNWSLAEGKIDNTMGGYTNFPTILFSIAIFIFVKYDLSRLFIFDKINSKILRKVSATSFGVYLTHYYFVQQVPIILGFSSLSLVWRSFGVLALYTVCVVIILVIQKIPILKKLVP